MKEEVFLKRKRKKIFAIISVVLSLTFILNTSAFAFVNSPDYFTVDSIDIVSKNGILEGTSYQLYASLSPEDASSSAVEWSSTNPDAVSCTSNGIIRGVTAGKSAEIICKSKFGDAMDSVTVYCVKPVADQRKSEFVNPITIIYKQPGTGKIASIHYSLKFIRELIQYAIYRVFLPAFGMLSMSNASTPSLTGGYCEVLGKWGSYAYIEANNNENVTVDGFVRYTRLDTEIRDFLNISATDINVWANGISDPNKKLTSSYKGEINWAISDPTVIRYDKATGQITGLKPGTATITATADGMSKTCTVHSLYPWPQTWVGKANCETDLYTAKGFGYTASKVLSVGNEFTVYGDDGSDNGWAYGKATIAGEVCWGFVPISHISTKGTVSQYNSMNFRWPVYDINIKKISSPFGPRSTTNGGNHKGFDIVSDNAGEVEGKSVVASYDGTIKKIYIDNDKKTSHGNAIVITTNKIDPISGKNLTVIYMHLSRWDTNSSGNIVVNGKVLKEGISVTKEQLIGYAGNTGYNTSGAHLHYEVNNQNAAIRSGSNNPFTETINPIYFYMDMDENITKSDKCEAASNGNGFYWYGENE